MKEGSERMAHASSKKRLFLSPETSYARVAQPTGMCYSAEGVCQRRARKFYEEKKKKRE